jgi:hypothetical protein
VICGGVASAAPAAAAQARVVGTAREKCPALFGASAVRKANAKHRARYLHWVVRERAGITIAHSHPRWREPLALEIAGVRVVPGGERPLVEVEPPLAREVGCPSGVYVVKKDDVLGHPSRIIAARPGLLLVEHRGELGYMVPEGASPPEFLMAWRIPQAELRRSRSGGGRSSARAARARHKARKARKARQTRKARKAKARKARRRRQRKVRRRRAVRARRR